MQPDHLGESKIKPCGAHGSSDGSSNRTTLPNSRLADSETKETVAISSFREAAQKSEELEHVAGGGGDSRESCQSNAGGTPSVATQGATTECQDLTAAANISYAAAAKKSVKPKRVGGSGGGSQKSHYSEIGSMSSIAA